MSEISVALGEAEVKINAARAALDGASAAPPWAGAVVDALDGLLTVACCLGIEWEQAAARDTARRTSDVRIARSLLIGLAAIAEDVPHQKEDR